MASPMLPMLPMFPLIPIPLIRAIRLSTMTAAVLLGAAALIGPCGCASSNSPAPAAASTTERFVTADAAVEALVAGVRANDMPRLARILGPEAGEALNSGDEVADANGRADFLRLYDEKHRLEPTVAGSPDSMTLSVGATDWPLPIPVVKDAAGWSFDTAAGLDEMLSRRIGRNELATIQVCLAIVDAEREYAANDHEADGWREYARAFRSAEGKKNGLYWASAAGEPQSPLGERFAAAEAEGYTIHDNPPDVAGPYHGYYYRILTSQGPAAEGGAIDFVAQGHMIGGFGVVAWPADYANSGLKTFITSHHGAVYERDLGDDTERRARAIASFNPEAGWQPCKDQDAPAK